MRLLRFYKVMFSVTILALTYIHMQMQIYQMAYHAKMKHQRVVGLNEKNDLVRLNILKLKSAQHLGLQLLSKDSVLKFRDKENVIQIVTDELPRPKGEAYASAEGPKALLTLLPFRAEAEARTRGR